VPIIPNLPEPLTDGVVALRLFADRDIPEILIAYQDDPEMHLRLGEPRPPSGAELGRRSERSVGERESGSILRLTIVRNGSDTCVGGIIVHDLDWFNARAELGIWLAPQVRGGGLAARALVLVASWLFARCGLQRLQLLTETDNAAMLGTAAAAGFVHEGVLRGYTREHGQRIDCAVLSLLPSDLPR
jgi:RimJ/RimL family protein N-acetyltransferase